MLKFFLMQMFFRFPVNVLKTCSGLKISQNQLKSFLQRKFFIQMFLFVSICSVFILKCHKMTEDTPALLRIAVLPFEKSELSPPDRWSGWAAEEIIFNHLRFDSAQPVVVYDLDNLRKIIQLDSLADQNYLNRFAQKVKLDYFIAGCIRTESGCYQIHYEIKSTGTGFISTSTANFRNLNELDAIGLIIANKLQKSLPLGHNGRQIENTGPPASIAVNYFKAKEQLFDNKIEDAKKLLNQATLEAPEDAISIALLGRCFFLEAVQSQSRGFPIQTFIERADFYLTAAVKRDSNRIKIRHYSAQYHIFMHNWNAAEQEALKFYRINRMDPEVYVLLSQLNPARFNKVGFKNETELLEYALFLNPGHLSAILTLSKFYVDYCHDLPSAIKIIQQALVINPDQPELLAELGRLYVMSGEFLKIMPVFERIMEIDPANANALYNLGIYYYNQKDFSSARRLFERAIEIDSHLDSHLYLAYIYEQLASTASDPEKRRIYIDTAISHFRYRVKHKRDSIDAYAEMARRHLNNLVNN